MSPTASSSRPERTDKFLERVIHDEERGEENVELVDSEWADFERALRYTTLINFNGCAPTAKR